MWRLKSVSPFGDEWKSFVEARPHLLFHEPKWMSVCEKGLSVRPCAFLLKEDEVAVAGMAGFIKQFGIVKLMYMNFPHVGGILGTVPEEAELAQKLREVARQQGITRIKVSPSPNATGFSASGFDTTPVETQVLHFNGRTHEKIMLSIEAKRRRFVRKSLREGVVADEDASDEAVDSLYSMYLETMNRNKAVAVYNKAFMHHTIEDIVNAGRGALILARCEGQAIAGVLLVDSADGSHFIIGASRTELRKLRPNDLMMSAAIKRAVERNLDYFDFGPSPPNNKSLVAFKSSWGGEPHAVPAHTLTTRPALAFCWDRTMQLAATPPARAAISAYRKLKRSGASAS